MNTHRTQKVVHISHARRVNAGLRHSELQALVAAADSSVPWQQRWHPQCTASCMQGRACDCVADVDTAGDAQPRTQAQAADQAVRHAFANRLAFGIALAATAIAVLAALFGAPVELPR